MSIAPPPSENAECLLCGSSEPGIEVGKWGRFGMPVRNVACQSCGLVFQSPRPSQAELAAYYSGKYREHYGSVKYPWKKGAVGPGDPGYTEALDAWHTNQAQNAAKLGQLRPADRVLEIGCRHARTLAIQAEIYKIKPYGVEPGPAEAQAANAAGIQCFQGVFEDYEPGELRFEQIQLFHVLEHLYEPLSALIKLRSWLSSVGRLVIEVPNVYQPYGLLEENFFQNAHLANYSPVTLEALLRRAGFQVTRVVDESVLFAVAVPDLTATALPLPFEPALLSNPAHTATWVAERLSTYALLEKQRTLLQTQGPDMELIQGLIQTLQRPWFVPHTINTVTEVVQYFVTRNAPKAAELVAQAALLGAKEPEIGAQLERLARAVHALSA